jgi:hypothetical protein
MNHDEPFIAGAVCVSLLDHTAADSVLKILLSSQKQLGPLVSTTATVMIRQPLFTEFEAARS